MKIKDHTFEWFSFGRIKCMPCWRGTKHTQEQTIDRKTHGCVTINIRRRHLQSTKMKIRWFNSYTTACSIKSISSFAKASKRNHIKLEKNNLSFCNMWFLLQSDKQTCTMAPLSIKLFLRQASPFQNDVFSRVENAWDVLLVSLPTDPPLELFTGRANHLRCCDGESTQKDKNVQV